MQIFLNETTIENFSNIIEFSSCSANLILSCYWSSYLAAQAEWETLVMIFLHEYSYSDAVIISAIFFAVY